MPPRRSSSPASTPAPEQALTIAGRPVTVETRINPRARRIGLRIDAARDRVVMVVPHRRHMAEARRFLRSRAAWVADHLDALPPPLDLVSGASLPLLGDTLTICHRPDTRRGVWREGDVLNVSGRAEHLPRRVRDWLRARAREAIESRVAAHAERSGRHAGTHHPARYALALGQLLALRRTELQLAPGDGAGLGAGLCCRARGRPPARNEPLPRVLASRGDAGSRRARTRAALAARARPVPASDRIEIGSEKGPPRWGGPETRLQPNRVGCQALRTSDRKRSTMALSAADCSFSELVAARTFSAADPASRAASVTPEMV